MPASDLLADTQGRRLRDLRVSVTDRCDLRCAYCVPARDDRRLGAMDLLTGDEIARLVRIAVGLGVTAVRITGGEPTLRDDLVPIVRALRALDPALDLGLTTNGVRLGALAGPLRAAGLGRLNVSLDTLDRERFRRLAGRDRLPQVLAGLEAAKRAGFPPVKINAVPIRGVNDDEIVPLARWAREQGFELRLIEWMPVGAGTSWSRERLVPAAEVHGILDAVFPLEPLPAGDPAAPAERYRYRDGGGTVGIIASVTHAFCERCDRLRITADGQVRGCLFAREEHDLRTSLRAGAADEELAAVFRAAARSRGPGHRIAEPGFAPPERGMNAIGG